MMPKYKASHTGIVIFALLGVSMLFNHALFAQVVRHVDPAAISDVVRALEGPMATEPPVVYQQEGGFIHFLGAPPQARFIAPVASGKHAVDPETIALSFMEYHGAAFGLELDEVELRIHRALEQNGKTFVRMDQYYEGLMVFGAQVVVQVNDDLAIRNIMSDVMRDPGAFMMKRDALTPVLTADQAIEEARRQNAALSENERPEDYETPQAPQLLIFHPNVLSMAGDTRLAWEVYLVHREPFGRGMIVLIDAQTGELLLRYADRANARYREVYDCGGIENLDQARLVRAEGDAPIGNAEIDRLYDYLGDSYDWYWEQHGRDSFDGRGGDIIAYANFPFMNAAWVFQWGPYSDIMLFGPGFITDDIVGHEFTHGVTSYVSDMIYFSFSGAINEMYSDQGGEFIDLTNGRGNDSPEVRWFIGEDMTIRLPDMRGLENETAEAIKADLPGIRYMKDPTVFGHPDRLGSPLLADPFSMYDLGGVHINNGVGNKLVYLLTDGDEFNGQTVTGMGIEKVADLFYEARPLLGRTPTYFDFYFALGAASVDIGMTMEERLNVVAGTRAVEIEPPDVALLGLRDFRATPTEDTDDNPVIALTWSNPPAAAYTQLTLYKGVSGYPTGPLTGVALPIAKNDTKYLDREVIAGVEYFYTLIAETGIGFPQIVKAKAVAGSKVPDLLTEAFGYDPNLGEQEPFDLAYSQITIRPVGPPPASLGVDTTDMSYDAYEATVANPVYELPVKRRDAQGGAYTLVFTDDGLVIVELGDRVFPFFGKKYNRVVIGANGYIGFDDFTFLTDQILYYLNFPSLAAHFALPRISFLFTDLAPHMGGDLWARILSDRMVLTFENVPVWPTGAVLNPQRNTVQVELFDSGMIRMTYLNSGISNGVVGLSDGRGVPRDPFFEFSNLKQAYKLSDFAAMSNAHSRLSIKPIAPAMVDPGEVVEFLAGTVTPAGATVAPALTAEWDGPGGAPFADLGDGTGRFYWETRYADKGMYTLRVKARLGDQHAFQDVRIIVGEGFVRPEAIDLQLSTNSDYEDPRANRAASAGVPLIASYTYYHPYRAQSPVMYAEGTSLLYWFRNGQIVPAFTNLMAIPPEAPQPGDQWWFQVTPISLYYIWGNPAASPVVTILGVPEIHAIEPAQGVTIGGDTITIRGRYLTSPMSVTFSEVPAPSIRAISDTELTLITPMHPSGKATVSVQTPGGIGRRIDGFTFVGDKDDTPPEEEEPKRRRIFGCGLAERPSRGYDLLFVAFAIGALVMMDRRRKSAVS